jgi:uncharacterized protein
MATSKTETARWRGRYGPSAVVTGASDGIGLEIARDLAARGLNIVLVARRLEKLVQIAGELRQSNAVETLVIAADLGKANEVDRVVQETKPLGVGLLVASAGFGTAGNFLNTNTHDEIDMVNVNCRAVLALSKAFAARFAMRRSSGG